VQAMERAGFDIARTREVTSVGDIGQYLELRIEQGPVLEEAGADIGIVSRICSLLVLQVILHDSE